MSNCKEGGREGVREGGRRRRGEERRGEGKGGRGEGGRERRRGVKGTNE